METVITHSPLIADFITQETAAGKKEGCLPAEAKACPEGGHWVGLLPARATHCHFHLPDFSDSELLSAAQAAVGSSL